MYRIVKSTRNVLRQKLLKKYAEYNEGKITEKKVCVTSVEENFERCERDACHSEFNETA